MKAGSTIEPEIAQQISAVREFNRFYTARLGLLRRRHLDGEFSLTEARMLYEIGAHPRRSASTLCGTLELDAGHISRLLTALTKRKLVRQAPSEADGRVKLLTLSAVGEKAVERLNAQSMQKIASMPAICCIDCALRRSTAFSPTADRVRSFTLPSASDGAWRTSFLFVSAVKRRLM